jgi:hypothetical protein
MTYAWRRVIAQAADALPVATRTLFVLAVRDVHLSVFRCAISARFAPVMCQAFEALAGNLGWSQWGSWVCPKISEGI